LRANNNFGKTQPTDLVYITAGISGKGVSSVSHVGKNYTFSRSRSETECSVLKGSEILNMATQQSPHPTPLPRRKVASKMFSFTGLPRHGHYLASENIYRDQ
jgi:hypothetical protein